MAKKGEKMSAETRAKMSQAHRDRWVKIRQQMDAGEACSIEDNDDQHLIDTCVPRCKQSLRDRLWEEVKGWFVSNEVKMGGK